MYETSYTSSTKSAPQAGRSHRRFRGRSALALACVAAGVTGTTLQAPAVAPLVVGTAEPAVVTRLAAAPSTAPSTAAAEPAARAPVPLLEARTRPATQPAPFPTLGQVKPGTAYYEQLRAQLRWIPVQVGERQLATPDARSRLLLAQSAARHAGLQQVGLDWRDVYGVINAETSWVPRTGMGKNGVASYGLGQFEPATARAVGLRNPNDPVEAVHASAVLLKEAAEWSARRIASLKLTPQQEAVKLREGVSIYYNLSSRARKQWSGLNTHVFPVETQRHIRNVRTGARQAEVLHARVVDAGAAVTLPPVMVAAAEPAPARITRTSAPAPQAAQPRRTQPQAARTAAARPEGTIAWANGSGARKVSVGNDGRVRWTSAATSNS